MMDPAELKKLQTRVLKTKKDLRDWEGVFQKKHHRPPTIQDIAERPNIEKFYKKYNQLKKDLKRETELVQQKSTYTPHHISSPTTTATSPDRDTTTTVHRQKSNSSVEFVRSPKRPVARSKLPDNAQQYVRKLTEFDQKSKSEQDTKPVVVDNKTKLAEDEAFWLGIQPSQSNHTTQEEERVTSSSQPVGRSNNITSNKHSFGIFSSQQQPSLSPSTTTTTTIITDMSRLGQSQPILRKRNIIKEQKLFGRVRSSPFQRNNNSPFQELSSSQFSTFAAASQPVFTNNTNASSQPLLSHSSSSSQPVKALNVFPDFMEEEEEEEEEKEDDMEEIQIVNLKEDRFRHYDPSLFNWDDPSFSVGPGFFANSQVCHKEFMIEPDRRNRVLKKLMKGTLGEVIEENYQMEQDIGQDIKEFIEMNTITNSFESSVEPIQEELLNQRVYKKRGQKRQTRLYKMKFVET